MLEFRPDANGFYTLFRSREPLIHGFTLAQAEELVRQIDGCRLHRATS